MDEQFGAAILPTPRPTAIATACPAEKSGQDEFDFEYGEEFARHIEKFNPTFCKVLVRYNPEGDRRSTSGRPDRLKRLSDYLADQAAVHVRAAGAGGEGAARRAGATRRRTTWKLRPGLMVRAIQELQDAGIEADVWKIEGLDRREDCEKVVAAARRGGRDKVGCIILGRGEDDKKVREWLGAARRCRGSSASPWAAHVLGSAGRLEGREDDARAGGRPDRQPLSRVGRPLRREVTMQLGMIGLGRMGANTVRRLLKGGHNAWCSTCRPRRWPRW